tara:strand:- start:12511 stop:12729 length:219 start_codon:yes stop_codon:yes gene_type:complete
VTELGIYFTKRSINRSDVARKTGINKTRMSDLSNNPRTKLRVRELYLIALAIEADPSELFKEICKDYKLPKQ